ncbi:MAG: hypothetical protein U9R47_09900 [Actinomycetota bacterium]|nr:hypothetical protein [Actinomycetota bacterium]
MDSIDDLYGLIRSRDDRAGGICAHGAHQTVYSYVLRHHRGAIALSVTQGPPCAGAASMVTALPIGESWSLAAVEAFKKAYPSARPTKPD